MANARQSNDRDYVAIATDYAKKAASKKNKATYCKWIRLAAERFLNDLKLAAKKNPPFIFDEWHANDVCDFIEKLPHVEGTWDSATIILHESDVFFLVNLFGFRKYEGGPRRFTTALKAIGRKNAKSTIAAGIGLYCENCEGENGPQVISAATTGPQARIIFNIAKRMVEKTSALREAFSLQPLANSIVNYDNGGTFKPINAKASTQDGLNPSGTLLDEIHAHKDSDLLNVLRSAAGARRNPLFLFTTTEGYESPGPWGELRNFAQQVLEGVIEAHHFLVLYYTLDDDDDVYDESNWIKANPLIDVNGVLLDEIRKEAIEAKAMPGKAAEFRIKRCNVRSSTSKGWIDFQKWKKCAGAVDLDMLKTVPCWGGLDLSSTRDITSFRLVWMLDDIWYTHGWRWVPSEQVEFRTTQGTVPYQGWVEKGHLIEIEGATIDYSIITKTILELSGMFNLQMIGYDPWNAATVVKELSEAGIVMDQFIQGPKSYHPAMSGFEMVYSNGRLRHNSDPVLTWNASNLVVRYDENNNMAPSKKRSADKIDDMVALLMAHGVANREPDTKPNPYSDRGIRTLEMRA